VPTIWARNQSLMVRKAVILDKSFVQAEGKQCRRLRALREGGCVFVLTDTLLYELCTGKRDTMWLEVQRKLFDFPDDIEVWRHTAELLKEELDQKRPVLGPYSEELTERTRDWFRSRQQYAPPDLKEVCRQAEQQREQASVESLIKMCRTLAGMAAEVCKNLQYAVSHREDVSRFCHLSVNDPRLLHWLIRLKHGVPTEQDIYLPGAENGLDERWFAYHEARCHLALFCVFMVRYGECGTPGIDFCHTKLDADYLALLHYGDGLATNETSGSMADMCSWLYGRTKRVFCTADIDALMPTTEEVQINAFYQWEQQGRTHGHDVDDWSTAERRLWRDAWGRLDSAGG
jgi:hypothetical protein